MELRKAFLISQSSLFCLLFSIQCLKNCGLLSVMAQFFIFFSRFPGLSSSFTPIVFSQLTSNNVFSAWDSHGSNSNWSFLGFTKTRVPQPLHILTRDTCTHTLLDWKISSLISTAVLKLAFTHSSDCLLVILRVLLLSSLSHDLLFPSTSSHMDAGSIPSVGDVDGLFPPVYILTFTQTL